MNNSKCFNRILSILLLCVAVFISGCAGTLSEQVERAYNKNGPTISPLPDGYKIALISLVGDQLAITKEGITVFDSYSKYYDVSEWNIDLFVADTIKTTILPKFILTKCYDRKNTNITFDTGVTQWGNRVDAGVDAFVKKNKSLLQEIAESGVDAVLVAAPMSGIYDNQQKMRIYNYGLLYRANLYFLPSDYYSHSSIELRLINAKNMENVVNGLLIFENRPLDKKYWIETPDNPSKEIINTLQPIIKEGIARSIIYQLQSMAMAKTK